ncbi:hypothetical protein GCU60_13430 [Blastococcus saxobsidens]|uniref:Two pore domain potassium channel family protein n=1 Tax=Blastococcus saxobsidens TaxID=138336 RepID=A0A6L9W3S2_9ACTN|nr:hypothetical protein [Blastococcus saxobsidens]NEK86746.1 hypothetical protein [Blastococcus saxobsidens]
MGGAALVAAGSVLVLLVLADVLLTTLTLGEGAGPLTRRLLGLLWRGSLRLRRPGRRSRLLSNSGPALLVVTVAFWLTTTWLGWWLVFLGSGSVRSAETQAPAGPADVAYYAGYAISTLGTGDFVADSSVWRILTALAGVEGLILVTLSITYLLGVVSAVVARRALATQVHALGGTAGEIVVEGWTGHGFSPAFTQHLVGLTTALTGVVQQHFAYPVLHYFRTASPAESAPVAVALLDDVLLLLDSAVDAGVAPDASAVRPARRTVADYVRTVGGLAAGGHPGDPPPCPSVVPLERAGIPLRSTAERDSAFRSGTDRRRGLRQLVEEAGWSWPGA